MSSSDPVALVTGCSSGIGRETVPLLATAGFLVVATARNGEAIKDLAAPGRVEPHVLDVTDPKDRERVVDGIMERHGRLDVLVNNAGFGAVAAVEETPPDLMQRLFETNLFGLHELTRLCLPIMREQHRGRIVNVSSVSGHIGIPLTGAYCASKFALRGLTMTMDVEIRPHGLRAVLIEPGFVSTPFGKRSTRETAAVVPDPAGSPYSRFHARWSRRRSSPHGVHPSVIARTIVDACTARRPRVHYFAPFHAKAANLAKRLLPDSIGQYLLGRYFTE